MVLLKYNTGSVTVCLIPTKEISGNRDFKSKTKIVGFDTSRALSAYVPHVISSGYIAIYATENGYNNHITAL